ncbi:MJ0042-type zinc finger domain-containing protein [Ectothiorhodospira shaposhnikovii]|uniref:MJ0042-type zinc finger domain-containing protein n=1 Tax=Ectothiorhodospira shaposhnikovii TaxID=1054 RepID=UPI0039A2FC24
MLKVCPHCQARFYVSDSLRKFSGGQVRCGECGKTFDIQDPSSPSPLSWVEPSIPTLREDTPKPSSHSPFEADSGTIENATQDEGEIVDFDPQAEPKSATTTPDLPLPVPIIPILPPPLPSSPMAGAFRPAPLRKSLRPRHPSPSPRPTPPIRTIPR